MPRVRVNGRKPERDWSKIDWSLSTSVLAQRYGKTRSRISILRRKHAPHTIDKSNKSKKKHDVDWVMVFWHEKSTNQIAEETGCSKSQVSQMRRKYAPDTVAARKFNKW